MAKTFEIAITADTRDAIDNIEKLTGSLSDINNVVKPISTLAAQAGRGLAKISEGEEATKHEADAIHDLTLVLNILKESATAASGKMQGLETGLKNVAKARDVLARFDQGGGALSLGISTTGFEWSKEYTKLLASQKKATVDKDQQALIAAKSALEQSYKLFGRPLNNKTGFYSGTGLFYKELPNELARIQKAYKSLVETGKAGDEQFAETVANLKSRFEELEKAQKKVERSSGTMWKRMKANIIAFSTTMLFGKGLDLVFNRIPQLFAKASKAASDAAEANNLYVQTFDLIPDKANAASKEIQSSFGLAESTANNAIGTFAQYMVGLGKSQSEAVEFATKATNAFLDIKSFKNIDGDLSTFLQKAMSGLAGNTENFRTMGLAISATAAQERLMSKGLGNLTGEAKRAAIAQEYLNMVIEQSGDAMGDYARNYNSMQNTSQRLGEQTKRLFENLGKGINTWFTPFKKALADMLEIANTANAAAEEAKKRTAGTSSSTGSDGREFEAKKYRKAYKSAFNENFVNYNNGNGPNNFEETNKVIAQSIEDVSKALGATAVETAKTLGMFDIIDESVRKSIEAFDEHTRKTQEAADAANRTADALKTLKDMSTEASGFKSAMRGGPESLLSPYEKDLGDYSQATLLGSYGKKLQEDYNGLSAKIAELTQYMSGLTKGTEEYSAARVRLLVFNYNLKELTAEINKNKDALAGLTAEEEKRKEAEKAEIARTDAEDAIKTFTSGLTDSLHKADLEKAYANSPYKDADVTRQLNLESLQKLLDVLAGMGGNADVIASLEAEAKRAIEGTYAYQKVQIGETAKKEADEAKKNADEAAKELKKAFLEAFASSVSNLGNAQIERNKIYASNPALSGGGTASPFAEEDMRYKQSLAELSQETAVWVEDHGMQKALELKSMKKSLLDQENINEKLSKLSSMDWSGLTAVVNDESQSKEVRAAAQAQKSYNFKSYANSQAMSLADSATGGIASGAVQGAAMGGPWGAVIGAVVALVQKLEVFQRICSLVDKVVEALNDHLSPFEPMLDMLSETFGMLMHALTPTTPMVRALASALTIVGYAFGSVANIVTTVYKLITGIVKDVFNGIGKSASAIGKFITHLFQPWNWGKLGKDIKRIRKAWDFDETSEAIEGWKDTQDKLNEQMKETNEAIWKIEKSSATTAENTSQKDTSKLQAWKELMDAGYLTGAQFAAMSKNYAGVGYALGSKRLDASNFGSFAGSSKSVNIGQVSIVIEGSGDPEAVAKKVEQILRNRAVYGASA